MRCKSIRPSECRIYEKWQLLNRVFDEYARAVGLTSMSLIVLGILYENIENCTQKLICEQSQFTKQSVNMIIKSFWEQGYVDLVEWKTDRRNKQVKLSKRGMAYAHKIAGCLRKVECDVMEKTTEEQREAVIHYTEVYEDCLQNEIAKVTGSIKGGKDFYAAN